MQKEFKLLDIVANNNLFFNFLELYSTPDSLQIET